MTESRDQRFFDALNSTGRDEDDDAQTGAPNSAGGSEVSPPAAPAYPPLGFAASEPQDDSASDRHHIEPPAGEVGGRWGQPVDGGGWGQPEQQAEPNRQPWPSSDTDGEAEASPPDIAPQPRNPAAQTFSPPASESMGTPQNAQPPYSPERPRETAEPAWRGPADQGGEPVPPPPPFRVPSSSGQSLSAAGGASPQEAPPAWPAPARSLRRSAPSSSHGTCFEMPRPATPHPRHLLVGRPKRGAPPPSGGQRPTPPPGWPARGPELRPPVPSAPSGLRPPEWDWSRSGGTGGAELRSEQISASELNAPRRIPSSRGWRKWLYYGTFKLINTGESPDEQLLRNLSATVAGHLRGTYSIVVLGGKGGVGKTTTAASVGSTFASLRKDKAVAIDANPDRASNLADRIDPSATHSYKDVLTDPHLQRYTDIRSHVGMNEAGLDVLGNRYQSDRQPLTAKIYTDTHSQLQRFYSVLISDSGTDVDHQVIPGLMDRADALIMVASTAPDGAKGAAELMDWAYEAGYHRLLQRTVVVINDVRGENAKGHRKLVDSLVEKFSRWVGQQRVFVVPFDPHIASAGVIDINELRPATRRRYLEITARVASGFNSSEDRR